MRGTPAPGRGVAGNARVKGARRPKAAENAKPERKNAQKAYFVAKAFRDQVEARLDLKTLMTSIYYGRFVAHL